MIKVVGAFSNKQTQMVHEDHARFYIATCTAAAEMIAMKGEEGVMRQKVIEVEAEMFNGRQALFLVCRGVFIDAHRDALTASAEIQLLNTLWLHTTIPLSV